MLTISQAQSANRSVLPTFLLALVGLVIGVVALQLWSLEPKWAVAASLILILPFVLLISSDVRRFLLAGIVLTLPLNADYNLFLQSGMLSGARALTISVLDLLLFVAVAFWLVDAAHRKQVGAIRFYPKISWPTLGLIAIMAVSTIAAKNRLWSLFDIIMYLKVYVFFLYLANNIRDRSDIRLIIVMFFIGIILQTGLSLWQINEWPGLEKLRLVGIIAEAGTAIKLDTFATTRPGGTMVSCNHLARFFGYLLPLAYILSLRGETGKERWFARLVSLIGTIGLIFTLSRSTWIAMIPSILILFPFMLSRRLLTLRIMRNIAVMMLLTVLLLMTFRGLIWDRIVSYDFGSGMTRITSAQAALRMIEAHPVLGVGINNYGLHAKYFYDAEEPRSQFWIVHNSFLLYAAEIGVIGFIFYLWFVFAGFSSASKASLGRSAYLNAVAVGIFAGWINFAIAALADKSYKEMYVLLLIMWSFAAMTEAIGRLNRQYEQTALNLLQDKSIIYEF